MITITIPGAPTLVLHQLVLDFNGTLATDGSLLPEAVGRLHLLAGQLEIHIITADTYGDVGVATQNLPVQLHTIGVDDQDLAKRDLIEKLGPVNTAAIGNGRNDILMLEHAVLGIGVVEEEGAYAKIFQHADIICHHIENALDLLIKPDRLRAVLRN